MKRFQDLAYRSGYSRSAFGSWVNFLFLLAFALLMALPMVYTFSNAFKPLDELFVFPPTLFPRNPTLHNFGDISAVMRESWVPMGRYILNSVFITAVGVAGQLLFASLAAYALAKDVFPGCRVLNKVVEWSLMFNNTVTAIPCYLVLSRLGMIDSPWALILPAFCSSLGLFLMRQFMEQMVPTTVLEAARIDRAGELTVFFRIVMPMCKPAWLTLIILSFQSLWANTGSVYLYSEQLRTLPYALQTIMSTAANAAGGTIARTGVSAAVTLLLILPPLITFIITQSNILETMSTSGMKD